jgi:hypothetical protein
MKGRSIELYLVDGRPDGMVTAEIANWTGHVLAFPRAKLPQALGRPEARRTGVYLLLGEREGQPLAYVGESEDIALRFKSHEQAKDWWTLAAIVTTAGNSLNKAHIRYLEARLVEEAKAAGSALDNGTAPTKGSLSEAAVANMEAFLDTLLMVLPVLRIDAFSKPQGPKLTGAAGPLSDATPVFVLQSPKTGVSAEAAWIDGILVVRAGSVGRAWYGKNAPSYEALQAKLIAAGVLGQEADRIRFLQDHPFDSPSAAGAVVNGRSTAGAVEWKLKASGQTYKSWEQAQLAKEAAE